MVRRVGRNRNTGGRIGGLARLDRRLLLASGFASMFVVIGVLIAAGVAQPFDGYAVRHLMPGLGADFQKPSLLGRLIPFLTEAQRHHEGFQQAVRVISFPASGLPSLVLLMIGCFLLWRRGDGPDALTWVAVWAVAIGTELISEALVSHKSFLLTSPYGVVRPVPYENSYPSGHAIRAALLAALASRLFPRLGPYCVVWTATVAVGLELGAVHTPTDILGGLALAAFLITSTRIARLKRSNILRPAAIQRLRRLIRQA